MSKKIDDDVGHKRLLCAGILTSITGGCAICASCSLKLNDIASGLISGNSHVLENLNKIISGAKEAARDARVQEFWDCERPKN